MNVAAMGSVGSNPLDLLPMRGRQIAILVVAMLLAALDGYDALSMALAAPAIGRDWHLGKGALGLLLSSSLIGMAFGSLVVSPAADRMGRRPMVLACIVLMSIGSLISAFAGSATVLLLSRVLTGIGLGTMVVMTTLISAEFSNARRRSVAVASVATVGLPLGGVLGGLAASVILKTIGWPWIFAVGAIAGGVLLAAASVLILETPSYLLARRPPTALAKLNRTMSALQHPTLAELPPERARQERSYRALFTSGMARVTLQLTAVNLLVGVAAYYLISWMPQLITEMGFSPSKGSLIVAISHLVALTGGVTMGALAARIAPTRVAMAAVIGIGASIAAVGFTPPTLALVVVSTSAFSFFVAGTTGVLYAIYSASFPPLTRASGIGFIMGLGRVASAGGPALAGWMFSSGLGRGEVSGLFALAAFASAALLGFMSTRRTAQS